MAHPAADRNLLFGILAVQMDFVSRDDLIAGMQAWVLDKGKPLGRILVERGALAEDEHALLEPLVAKHIKRHGDDVGRSLAALETPEPIRGDLGRVADEDLTDSLGHLGGRKADSLATRMPTAGDLTSAGSRFRTLRFHARGGLGQVFVALDSELNREVALKEIQDRHADELQSRARFVLEAEVTGGLEHPGIVPVYGLGHHADGRPYYAMRFIRGDSLKEAIDRFHGPQGPAPDQRTLELRKLLARFVAVCETMAYAHSRGILHRDLKPANVMLGPYGETLVVDWGLAKTLGSDPDSPTPYVGEAPFRSSASGVDPTMLGSAVGTPAYMSPEQSVGEIDRLCPISDVFSLGATLYHLLTGRAPFRGGDEGEIRRKVRAGDFTPPRQVHRWISPGLEAICQKAMATRQEDRYRSAKALAEDIERWLADDPIEARPDRLDEKVARWARRHRAWTRAGAFTLVVVSVVSAAAALMIRAAQGRERAARIAKETLETKSRQRLADLEYRAWDRLARGGTSLARGELDDAHRLFSEAIAAIGGEPVRAELKARAEGRMAEARKAIAARDRARATEASYREFQALRDDALYHRTLSAGDDPAAERAAARDAARRALAIYGVDERREAPPAIPTRLLGPGRSAAVLADLFELLLVLADVTAEAPRDPGQSDEEYRQEARARAREALAILDRAEKVGQRTRALLLRRAGCLAQLGEARRARDEEARAQAVEPERASDFFLVGIERFDRGELAEATRSFEGALKAEPDHFWARYFLAIGKLRAHRPGEAEAHLGACIARRPRFSWPYILRGLAHVELADFPAAEDDFRKAEEIRPDEYAIFVNRAALEVRRGRADVAVAELHRALELWPGRHQARVGLAKIYDARKLYDEAVAQLGEAIKRAPALPSLYWQRGQVLLKQGRREAALRDYAVALRLEPPGTPFAARLAGEEALEVGRFEEAIAAFDRYLGFGVPEADVFAARGSARAILRDYPGAVADYRRALELDPNASNLRARLGWAYQLHGADLALDEFEAAIRLNPENGDALNGRGFLLALRGRHREAARDAEEAVRLAPPGWEATFNAACIFAQAMERAREDAADPARDETAAKYRDRALQLIRASLAGAAPDARAAVWKNVAADPSLEPVRRLPEFEPIRGEFAVAGG